MQNAFHALIVTLYRGIYFICIKLGLFNLLLIKIIEYVY